MVELMENVTKIKQELSISESIIVLKARHSLRGRDPPFNQHWKPTVRIWMSFQQDFEIVFSEHGTPATPSSFHSFVDYENSKLRTIKRFLSGLSLEHNFKLSGT
ncbi:hypothetical protein GWI33_008514 [Rhynchophorus ferrugineus]|uniref:Uncharacterized protein n=1 Tax=Rhynchophorus ferrugineus TaxID=354439 RepID=A0A834ME49_RHYFE|nr:hypothetical protein GWI33_008514 [Rhynchophorus ferrugineus]